MLVTHAPDVVRARMDVAGPERARAVRAQLPPEGLFENLQWRLATGPLSLPPALAREIEEAGRVFLQFYRASQRLYRRSLENKAPAWIAQWLDQGKPEWLLTLQRDVAFKNDVPRVIRPDLLLCDGGLRLTELDSVPGGIGLTAWLYQAYSRTPAATDGAWLGSADAMIQGFAGIFGDAPRVHLMVSEESRTYRPEMTWLASQSDARRFHVTDASTAGWSDGDAVYRFFELFDVANIPAAPALFEAARSKKIRLTPPPKPLFEEKLLFALLWNRHLHDFWRQELGDGFLKRLQRWVPYSWALDPSPIPPHAAIPELGLTDWHQLKTLSQRDRDLILKISGYSPEAWGARGVHLGSDLSASEWAAAVEHALAAWGKSPYVLQRYEKPDLIDSAWVNAESGEVHSMPGRVRLCPYYFVHGDGDAARPTLGGVLATVCPADKKIIHGMQDAILAPCSVAPASTPA